ncbi:MAG: hypothetical protein FJ088_09365, partial [Deltaproteobacteria bacterium]|nr:hypothetical protein [Deltaproteobacteria bacterium]
MDLGDIGKKNGLLWKILPWIVTVALLAYLGATTDFQTMKEAFEKAHKLYISLTVIFFVFLAFFFDTFCLKFLGRLVAQIKYSEMLPIKGASYLLNIINYNLATGLMAVFLNRNKGVPIYRAFSMMIFLTYIDLVALSVLAFAGLLSGGGEGLPRGVTAVSYV